MITTLTNHGNPLPLITSVDHGAIAAKCALLIERSELHRLEHTREVEWRSVDDDGKTYKFRLPIPRGVPVNAMRELALQAFMEKLLPEIEREFTT